MSKENVGNPTSERASGGFGIYAASLYSLSTLDHSNEASYSGVHSMANKVRGLETSTSVNIVCLGCGNGVRDLEWVLPIAQQTNATINMIGFDLDKDRNKSDSVLKKANEFISYYCKDQKINNINPQMNIADLRMGVPIRTNSVDMAIARYSLHWMGSHAPEVIKDMIRILKPGGTGLITVATPHDVIVENQVYDGKKYTRNQVAVFHPKADNVNRAINNQGKPVIIAIERNKMREAVRNSSTGVVIRTKHNSDMDCEIEMSGFTPRFFVEQLPTMGAELIQYSLARNDVNKNGKKASGHQEGWSRFCFITVHFKKNI